MYLYVSLSLGRLFPLQSKRYLFVETKFLLGMYCFGFFSQHESIFNPILPNHNNNLTTNNNIRIWSCWYRRYIVGGIVWLMFYVCRETNDDNLRGYSLLGIGSWY